MIHLLFTVQEAGFNHQSTYLFDWVKLPLRMNLRKIFLSEEVGIKSHGLSNRLYCGRRAGSRGQSSLPRSLLGRGRQGTHHLTNGGVFTAGNIWKKNHFEKTYTNISHYVEVPRSLSSAWLLTGAAFCVLVAYVSISTCRSVSVGTFQFMQCPARAPWHLPFHSPALGLQSLLLGGPSFLPQGFLRAPASEDLGINGSLRTGEQIPQLPLPRWSNSDEHSLLLPEGPAAQSLTAASGTYNSCISALPSLPCHASHSLQFLTRSPSKYTIYRWILLSGSASQGAQTKAHLWLKYTWSLISSCAHPMSVSSNSPRAPRQKPGITYYSHSSLLESLSFTW